MTTFGNALIALKAGKKVKRFPWINEYLVLIEQGSQKGTNNDRKTGTVTIDCEKKLVYSYIAYCDNDLLMPWAATHIDILEEDWITTN